MRDRNRQREKQKARIGVRLRLGVCVCVCVFFCRTVCCVCVCVFVCVFFFVALFVVCVFGHNLCLCALSACVCRHVSVATASAFDRRTAVTSVWLCALVRLGVVCFCAVACAAAWAVTACLFFFLGLCYYLSSHTPAFFFFYWPASSLYFS